MLVLYHHSFSCASIYFQQSYASIFVQLSILILYLRKYIIKSSKGTTAAHPLGRRVQRGPTLRANTKRAPTRPINNNPPVTL
uniref:Uncharacterized protein n=1 Tax=Dulem virus 34 TaxID=3145752 RepID=A0AAU8B6V2_9CAUD